jgi:enoyl-CoA hydratase/carnithine racemase
MGLVNEIVKKDQLKDECLKIASKIAERPLEELILMKYIIKSMEE